jgi:succinate dehydrogenase / fumarate reductase cytochrome b subunit
MSLATNSTVAPPAATRSAPVIKSKPLDVPAPLGPVRVGLLWQNQVGKKFLMAATGFILAAYVVVHLLGNMQLYMGRETINNWAHLLHASSGFLWTARIVLLVAVLTHALAGIMLTLEKGKARPVAYAEQINIQASFASRTMIWSGLVIAAFVVYHVLHLTVGLHPKFVHLDAYNNVVNGFRVLPAAGAYVAAMIAVGFHLWHGLYGMFQSVGFRHPRYTPGVRSAAAIVGTLVALANISVPVAVLSGLVGN